MEGRPVFVLFGPTASGKTELLSRLFLESRKGIAAEVVSADSMQVYRGMDIGTAKPSPELRQRLPHHLIDIRDPNEQFNAGDFVRLADRACEDICSRGKLPVVSGGTGFYLKNFILGLSGAPPSDPALRETLKKELAEKGAGALMAELAEKDGESAARIYINDTYRLLRALEVLRLTGRPLSSFARHGSDRSGPVPRSRYRFLVMELFRPREELYGRIEERCREMFRLGLAGEVAGLFRKGYTPEDPGMRAIGYREFFVEEPWVEKPGTAGKTCVPLGRERKVVDSQAGTYPQEPAHWFAGEPLGRFGPGNDLFVGGMDPHNIHTLQNDDTPLLCGGESHCTSPPSAACAWRLSEDHDGVRNLAARNSRRYAKRQITFFASIPNVVKVSPEDASERILDLLSALVHTRTS